MSTMGYVFFCAVVLAFLIAFGAYRIRVAIEGVADALNAILVELQDQGRQR